MSKDIKTEQSACRRHERQQGMTKRREEELKMEHQEGVGKRILGFSK